MTNRSTFKLSPIVRGIMTGMVGIGLVSSIGVVHAADQSSIQSTKPPQKSGKKSPYKLGKIHTEAKSANASGSKTGQSVSTASTRTEVKITDNQVHAVNPVSSFKEALINQPNVVVWSASVGGLNSDNLYLRGFKTDYLGVSLDGIPLNSSDDGSLSFEGGILPNSDVASMNVQPGAGSASTIGDSDFGGSIGMDTAAPDSDFYVQPTLGYGSFGTKLYSLKLNSGLILNNSTSFYVDAGHQATDGYYHDTGTPFKNTLVFKSISKVGPGALTLYYDKANVKYHKYKGITPTMKADYGLKYGGYSDNASSPNYYGSNYKRFDNELTYAGYDVDFGGLKVSDKLYYFSGQNYSAKGDAKGTAVYQKRGWGNPHRIGNILKFNLMLGQTAVDFGLWTERENLHAYNAYIPVDGAKSKSIDGDISVKTTSTQPYVTLTFHPMYGLTITPGVKYAHTRRGVKFNGTSAGYSYTTWNKVLPSLGANLRVAPDVSLYANYTESFKPPTDSQFTQDVVNFNLKPESAKSYEVGSYWKESRWSGRFSLFRTDFRNYINTVTLADGSSEEVNVGNVLHEGASMVNSYSLSRQLGIFYNIGYLHAHNNTTNGPVEGAPRFTHALGMTYQQGGFQASAQVEYITKYYSTIGMDQVPGHLSSQANLSYVLPTAWTGNTLHDLKISLSLTNLFNTQHINKIKTGKLYYQKSTGAWKKFKPKPVFTKYEVPFNAFVSITGKF